MTIFSRRRLQSMLDDLAPLLAADKGRDILQRLNNKKQVEQALPAELELALLWAIRSLGDIDVEPDWWGDNKRPDAVTDTLVPGHTTAIEIAAPNDNAISGEEAMDAIALQISNVADRARKGAGDYLYFRFREESGYVSGRYVRRRLAPRDFKLPSNLTDAVTSWIASGASREERLRLQARGLDVEVEHMDHKQTRFHNLYSSMPPETHSLEDNPLFELLVRKARQLKAAGPGTLKMLFLADAGSTLLNRIGRAGETDHTHRFVSGREIILHFIGTRPHSVDAIVTFSPLKEFPRFPGRDPLGRKPRRWTVGYFGSKAVPDPPATLERLAAALPEPHYEGYQARSLFRQGAFSPSSTGQYLGMTIRGHGGSNEFSVEFPARMLLDLLAGRLTEERFRRQLAGSPGTSNVFQTWLDMGLTISGATMAPRDTDEDDDHLILHFSDDPAARPFTLSQRPDREEG